MEYTIHDAALAGFDRFVIVLKPGMGPDFREVCGARLEKKADVAYAYQDFADLPAFFALPEGRTKPYGTVPAVLSARSVIRDRFAVVNADDFYGPGAFTAMAGALARLPETGKAAMVAYLLRNTVSDFGTVTRGVCTVDNGLMTRVRETSKIGRFPDGTIRTTDADPAGEILDGDSAVSMNFWGFTPWALEQMQAYLEAFLRARPAGDLKSECLLPTMVGDMLAQGRLTVDALKTDESWFGMTYQEDRATTAAMLKKLTDQGKYPLRLF